MKKILTRAGLDKLTFAKRFGQEASAETLK